jgi:threonine/homoserine/homoserine lactone efflux protein
MMMSLIVGAVAGFILALPPGPVAVTAMKLALNKGAKHGIRASMGTALMDFLFCIISVFATSAFIQIIDSIAVDFPVAVLVFQLVVITGIVVYGFINLRPKKLQNIESITESQRPQFIEYLTHRGPFLLGFAVALANIANPTFLASISYVAMQVQKWGMIEQTFVGKTVFAVGFGIGTFLWLYIMVRVLIFYKPRMSPTFIAKIRKFAGITLIGFGTLLGYRVIEITKWSEIIRLIFAL